MLIKEYVSVLVFIICGELDELKKRFFRDNDYRLNDNIKATFDVLIRAIDTWFHIR